MVWRADGPQGNESAKVKYDLVPYTSGKVLDLGCGPFKAFPHFIGVDNGHHAKEFGWKFKPDLVVDTCERLELIATNSCDAVFSSHLLEHIADYKAALKEWWRVVKVGGHLCLYLPHKDLYPNIGKRGSNPDHKHDFVEADIVSAMRETPGWDLLRKEKRDQGEEYSMFLVFKKREDTLCLECWRDPRPPKTCAVVRYGAFGDALQTANLFPVLKREGYHITLYTTPHAWQCLQHDPHVDAVILQDTDQVPNAELTAFWEHEQKKYTKWVQLSESVEGTLLALPGRANHRWSHEMRHKRLNENYLEFMHELAGVPYEPGHTKFYASPEEKAWAAEERSKMDAPFVILWTLAGSSVHKAWPWLDSAIARIMLDAPSVHVVLAGGPECKVLERGWENEPRVQLRSGVWTIRQSLAFLEQVDLIVGPETGVMNAACFMKTPKVITMSHSSVNNLTRDWVNTVSLEPAPGTTPCYPCHQLHYSWQYCHQDVSDDCEQCDEGEKKYGHRACVKHSGVALCQSNISAQDMMEAIFRFLPVPLPEAA